MIITPEYLTQLYARQAYDLATARYEAETGENSLVERNAEDFIAECDRLGIVSQADTSERASAE